MVRVLEGRASGLEREVQSLREIRSEYARALSKACDGLRRSGLEELALEV